MSAECTGRWQTPGYWCSRMLLVEPLVDETVAKVADREKTSILVPAISDPCCARNRLSVVAHLWKTAMMAFCYRLRVRSIARVSQSQAMNVHASDLSNSTGYARTHRATKHLTLSRALGQVSCLAQSSYLVAKT